MIIYVLYNLETFSGAVKDDHYFIVYQQLLKFRSQELVYHTCTFELPIIPYNTLSYRNHYLSSLLFGDVYSS